MKKGFFLVLVSLILFPAALWGIAWYFSAANLANEFCQSNFSLFHEHVRCQKPHLALLVSAVSGFISFFLLGWGAKSIRKANEK
jgi:hypothetical protein